MTWPDPRSVRSIQARGPDRTDSRGSRACKPRGIVVGTKASELPPRITCSPGSWDSSNRFCWWHFSASSRSSWPSWPRGARLGFPRPTAGLLPAWVISRNTGEEQQTQLSVRGHGRFPADRGELAIRQLGPPLRGALTAGADHRVLPSLRSNMGALPRSWPWGSACVVLIALVAIWRRRHRRGRNRGCGGASQADSSPDVPAGPVVAADRGRRSGDQPVDSRGQRHPRRRDRRPGRHAADSRSGGGPAGDRSSGFAAADGLPGVAGLFWSG